MPKHTRTATWALALFLFFSFSALPQTDGSADVRSIEAKAEQIAQNDTKVAELNRAHLQTYSDEQDKLNRLKKELTNLYAERDEALDELRKGRFCNGCDNTASELRRKGTYDVEDHFARNGGTHTASPEQIKRKEEEYEQKIKAKEQELEKFKSGDNEFDKKRADIDRQMNALKEKSDKLREEIVALSKSYKEKVFEQGKSLHALWVDDLMRLVAQKHFAEDQINIYNVKLNDLAQEEAKAVGELRDKVTKKNEAEKQALNEKIAANKTRAQNLEEAHNNRVAPLNSSLSAWKTRLYAVNSSLLSPSLSQAEKEKLQAEKTDLENRIASTEKLVADYETAFKSEIQTIEGQNRDYADQVWKLTTNFSKILDEALANLKKAFAAKRTILNDAVVARRASLEDVSRLLMEKKEAYRGKNNQFVSKVDAERVRMLAACSKAGAGCYGTDAASAIVGNWSKVSGCVGEMEAAHHSDDAIYACEQETPMYRQYYSSLKGGLSDADRSALQRTTSRTRYDMIFKKITD